MAFVQNPISEQNDAATKWLELTSIPTAFGPVPDLDVSSTKWANFTQGNGAATADIGGTNFLQLLFWVEKAQTTHVNDMDIAIFLRHLDGLNPTALHPVLVARVTWADAATLLKSVGPPVNGMANVTWYLANAIDLSKPDSGAWLGPESL